MKALCLNNISKKVLSTLKGEDVVVNDEKDANAILVRSFDMHEYNLKENILAIARVGAGVNNIPIIDYARLGVVVFNTPGANANAVKELVLCSLFLASRGIIAGSNWVNENKDEEEIGKLAESAKAKFAGNEIYGKTIGVLGLGKIGILVANSCASLGMKVIGYDPYLTVTNAMKIEKDLKYVEKIEDAISNVDYITIHIPANAETKNLISTKEFKKMKKGTVLLNFSRDVLVDDVALKEAIRSGIIKKYVTDFANPNVVKLDNTICLPHLGASTEEAEDNCAVMAIDEVKDYLENGNITRSVNYPDVSAGAKGKETRICINHYNTPGMIAKFSSVLSADLINIENLVNKSKGEFAYTIIDIENKEIDKEVVYKTLEAIDGVLRVRIL